MHSLEKMLSHCKTERELCYFGRLLVKWYISIKSSLWHFGPNTKGISLEKQWNFKSLDAANQSIEIKYPKQANGDA